MLHLPPAYARANDNICSSGSANLFFFLHLPPAAPLINSCKEQPRPWPRPPFAFHSEPNHPYTNTNALSKKLTSSTYCARLGSISLWNREYFGHHYHPSIPSLPEPSPAIPRPSCDVRVLSIVLTLEPCEPCGLPLTPQFLILIFLRREAHNAAKLDKSTHPTTSSRQSDTTTITMANQIIRLASYTLPIGLNTIDRPPDHHQAELSATSAPFPQLLPQPSLPSLPRRHPRPQRPACLPSRPPRHTCQQSSSPPHSPQQLLSMMR